MEPFFPSKRGREEKGRGEEPLRKSTIRGQIFTTKPIEGASDFESNYHLGCVRGENIEWDDLLNGFADIIFGAPTLSLQFGKTTIEVESPTAREEIEAALRNQWFASTDILCRDIQRYFFQHPERMTGRYFETLPAEMQELISQQLFPMNERVYLSDGTWIPVFDAIAKIITLSLFGPHEGGITMSISPDERQRGKIEFLVSIAKSPTTGKCRIELETSLDINDAELRRNIENYYPSVRRLRKIGMKEDRDRGLLTLRYATNLKTFLDILNYELAISNGASYIGVNPGLINNLRIHLKNYNSGATSKEVSAFWNNPLSIIKDPVFIPLLENFGSIIASSQCTDLAKIE